MNSSAQLNREELAWLSLIDDESTVVQNGLWERLQEVPEQGISFLKCIEKKPEFSREVVQRIRNMLVQLETGCTTLAFRNFIESFNYELETGCLLLDRVEYPTVNFQVYEALFSSMAKRVEELMALPMNVADQCKVLSRVMFHEFGFRADHDTFNDPANSYLCQVIERRKGIPISLSCIYLIVAQRCNIALEPVSLPGRFMLGSFAHKEPLFVDVYEGGRLLSKKDLTYFLENMSFVVEDHYFRPCSVGEVLSRSCRNLQNHYDLVNLKEKVELYMSFVRDFELAYQDHAY